MMYLGGCCSCRFDAWILYSARLTLTKELQHSSILTSSSSYPPSRRTPPLNSNYLFNMEEDHITASTKSSSSKQYENHTSNPIIPLPKLANFDVLFSDPNRRWASDLLLDCARAVSTSDKPRVHHLMWILSELASPYGDLDQRIASYFLEALFARLTSTGPRTLLTLSSVSDRITCFESTRRTNLRFQDLSPWSTFGHVAANGAILDSFLSPSSSNPNSASRLHILDLSTTFCTQWPTLLESLATRSSGADDTPHLSITTVVPSSSPSAHRVMREIAPRIDKFARLMGVPFCFSVVHYPDPDLSTLDLPRLVADDGSSTTLAVNCVNFLHRVPPAGRRRDILLANIRQLRPQIVTLLEEEANLVGFEDEDEGFLKDFRECLGFFSAYFDSLDYCFPKTSNDRLALERAAGRAVVDLVACPAEESSERRERAAGWSRRMKIAGFKPAAFSDDVTEDLSALLKRHKEGWSMRSADKDVEDSTPSGFGGYATTGLFLTWKERPVLWASVWKA
ncbi:hypothetical protein HPP92_023656 [Vanilla planifolia]|uniref:Uncharacterized protein n=1 Tax=Vanilla planifolia TaxID=51239 RepID=A0A835UD22_VANPL|nr:hypothetical protein HPP92_023656 [Vanilla planifolia]